MKGVEIWFIILLVVTGVSFALIYFPIMSRQNSSKVETGTEDTLPPLPESEEEDTFVPPPEDYEEEVIEETVENVLEGGEEEVEDDTPPPVPELPW